MEKRRREIGHGMMNAMKTNSRLDSIQSKGLASDFIATFSAALKTMCMFFNDK